MKKLKNIFRYNKAKKHQIWRPEKVKKKVHIEASEKNSQTSCTKTTSKTNTQQFTWIINKYNNVQQLIMYLKLKVLAVLFRGLGMKILLIGLINLLSLSLVMNWMICMRVWIRVGIMNKKNCKWWLRMVVSKFFLYLELVIC